jgi:hypothetical protein
VSSRVNTKFVRHKLRRTVPVGGAYRVPRCANQAKRKALSLVVAPSTRNRLGTVYTLQVTSLPAQAF